MALPTPDYELGLADEATNLWFDDQEVAAARRFRRLIYDTSRRRFIQAIYVPNDRCSTVENILRLTQYLAPPEDAAKEYDHG
jgi:hypothetical protein